MKVTIVPGKPLTDEEKEQLRENAAPTENNPELFKEHMLSAKEVVIPEHVKAEIEAMGLTVDEVISMMLKQAGASQ